MTGAFVAGVLASAAFVQAAVAGDVAKSDGTPIDPKTWTGFGWGLGIAADFDVGGKRVSNAVLDANGIVRVTDSSSNVGVSFVLEAHYFAFEWQTGRQSWCTPSTSSWNFGIGLRVDPSAKVLADGVAVNRPPPMGITTTDLLIKKEPRYGIMLLSSFSF